MRRVMFDMGATEKTLSPYVYMIYRKCMYSSGDMFMHLQECNCDVYFLHCTETTEISTKMILKWVHKQLVIYKSVIVMFISCIAQQQQK